MQPRIPHDIGGACIARMLNVKVQVPANNPQKNGATNMIKKIFDTLEGIKDEKERILFLLDQLPPNEKVHVEKFIIERIHQLYAGEIQRDTLNVTD